MLTQALLSTDFIGSSLVGMSVLVTDLCNWDYGFSRGQADSAWPKTPTINDTASIDNLTCPEAPG
jgi:hypothetical protein